MYIRLTLSLSVSITHTHTLILSLTLTHSLTIFPQLGRPLAAVQHLLSSKYLIELMGGARHPELVNVYLKLVGENN